MNKEQATQLVKRLLFMSQIQQLLEDGMNQVTGGLASAIAAIDDKERPAALKAFTCNLVSDLEKHVWELVLKLDAIQEDFDKGLITQDVAQTKVQELMK